MNNIEDFTIFTESAENIGLLYNSYKGLFKIIDNFLSKVEKSVDILLEDPEHNEINLKDDINKFKNDIDIDFNPSPIDTKSIANTKKTIKSYRNDIDKILIRLSKIKNKISFGGNFVDGILLKPKVYAKEVNNDAYNIINKNIRNVNRALDWVEKIVIDLYNMIDQDLNILTIVNKLYVKQHIYESDETTITEAVGDADDGRPESDHPIKDALQDIDREIGKKHQQAKKKIQDVQNVGRVFMKPIKRTEQWISNMIHNWKDADENKIKEKMADPHARNNLLTAIHKAILTGSLLKAGLLLNPIFLFLSVTRGIGKNKREFRIRNEMIAELKTELEVIKSKIEYADRIGDMKAKYRLMRLKNEINKKLLRVGGDKQWKKFI